MYTRYEQILIFTKWCAPFFKIPRLVRVAHSLGMTIRLSFQAKCPLGHEVEESNTVYHLKSLFLHARPTPWPLTPDPCPWIWPYLILPDRHNLRRAKNINGETRTVIRNGLQLIKKTWPIQTPLRKSVLRQSVCAVTTIDTATIVINAWPISPR